MTIQEHVINVAKEAADEAFRYAKAVPADKLNWSPEDKGRTVIDMCREMAKTPDWAYMVLTGANPMDESGREEQKAEMESWKSVEECHNACKTKLAKLEELYKSMPDEKLSQTRWLPFNGGRDHTFLEMLEYPRWNFTYHLGQIAYIQTLYGNREIY
jgi:hypothetical protein